MSEDKVISAMCKRCECWMSFEYPKEPREFCEDCVWDVLAERDQRIATLENLYDETLSRNIALAKEALAQANRLATLEAMVKEALRVFDLHLNTPETRALRAQWKEISVDASKPQE